MITTKTCIRNKFGACISKATIASCYQIKAWANNIRLKDHLIAFKNHNVTFSVSVQSSPTLHYSPTVCYLIPAFPTFLPVKSYYPNLPKYPQIYPNIPEYSLSPPSLLVHNDCTAHELKIDYHGVNLGKDIVLPKPGREDCPKPQILKQTNKANSILGFLKQNLRNCPSYCRKSAYISLVRSVVEYTAIVWDPYEQGDIDRLERVQNRGIRFVSKDYTTRKPGTITALRDQLDLPTLEQGKRDLRHNLFRQVVEGSVPGLPVTNFLEPQKEN